jgi:hypothetical protein
LGGWTKTTGGGSNRREQAEDAGLEFSQLPAAAPSNHERRVVHNTKPGEGSKKKLNYTDLGRCNTETICFRYKKQSFIVRHHGKGRSVLCDACGIILKDTTTQCADQHCGLKQGRPR